MLADLLPLMNDVVRHWHGARRDVFGRPTITPPSEQWVYNGVVYDDGVGSITDHRARVVYSPGKALGPASREAMIDVAAVVWLIDHPFPITIGATFELPGGDTLKVARLERRVLPDGVLHKAYLT